jgi:hypothetical protein
MSMSDIRVTKAVRIDMQSVRNVIIHQRFPGCMRVWVCPKAGALLSATYCEDFYARSPKVG